ncbi:MULTISPECIES: CHASE2 domain-containing protein [Nostocales]|uniref:Adenylate cyclase n=3 Tax=Nostocales TaxID=1161 RepID=A0A0C1NDH4_9CYAN|nr:adenylate/guanylate cyclase domain-containing protein [Tolypothrix bouteillei]KAF3888245.1 adenylate/guanylate cyclase domain-containing protein [Tolypothrix bouteillei VB521301]
MRTSLKKLLWQHRGALMTAPAIAAIIIGLRYLGCLQSLELAALDRFFQLRPIEPRDSRIVIVEVNEKDIRKLRWPIPDAQLAKAISILKQQQPRAIGLDIYRDLPVEPGYQELVKVFQSTPTLIGIRKVVSDYSGSEIDPPPALNAEQVSANDLVVDKDGKLRRSLLSVKNAKGDTILSLGAHLALMYLEAQGIYLQPETNKMKLGKAVFVPFKKHDGGYVGADTGGYQIISNFRNIQQGFLTVSISDVLAGNIPKNFARDRIVLIGVTAESSGDFFYTPYSASAHSQATFRSAGAIVHADLASQIISAALEGRPLIKVWSETQECLWIGIWAIAGASIAWTQRYQRNSRVPAANLNILLLSLVLTGGCYVAFCTAWWLPIVPGLLALVGSGFTITAYIARNTAAMRQTFNRYLTDEVVSTLLETPGGLKLGGEKRDVTILISDLRGFSAISERVPPEKVVEIINLYLGVMTDVINRYKGTINDFMGDGIFVMFGAPIDLEDNAQLAVACAIEMQLAMDDINQRLVGMDLLPLEMGIGIHTGEVLAGNIGSHQRAKYTIMGSNVNLASRIETYTVGGQILVSQETLDAVGEIIQIAGQLQVQPKGFAEPITIYDIGGIGGQYKLALHDTTENLTLLTMEIPIQYRVMEGKHLSDEVFQGSLVQLSASSAQLRTKQPVQILSNLQIQLLAEDEKLNKLDVYAKVVKVANDNQTNFGIRFTATPTEIAVYFKQLCQSDRQFI